MTFIYGSQVFVPTVAKDDSKFRFGQHFTNEQIDYMSRRNPYANKLTYGVVRDAIGKGFKLVDENDKDIDVSKDFEKDMKKYLRVIINAFAYERAYGKAILAVFRESNKIALHAFSKQSYRVSYDKFGNIKEASLSLKIGGTIPSTETVEYSKRDAEKYIVEIITRPLETIGEGESVMLPVWDQLFGLSVLDEHAVYFAIRVGGGLIVVKVTQSQANDPGYMAGLETMIGNMNSANGVMIFPVSDMENFDREVLELKSGEQIDFESLRNLLLGSLSAQSGIPREVFLGSELGMRSAETNQSAYFSYLQDVQGDFSEFLSQIIDILNQHHNWFSEGLDYKIKYNIRETKTEEQTVNLLETKGKIVGLFKANMAIEDLADLLDLPLIEAEVPEIGENPDDETQPPVIEANA